MDFKKTCNNYSPAFYLYMKKAVKEEMDHYNSNLREIFDKMYNDSKFMYTQNNAKMGEINFELLLIKSRLEVANSNYLSLITKTDSLNTNYETTITELHNLKGYYESINTNLCGLKTIITDHTSKIEDIYEKLAKLSDDINKINKSISDLNDKYNNLLNIVNDLKNNQYTVVAGKGVTVTKDTVSKQYTINANIGNGLIIDSSNKISIDNDYFDDRVHNLMCQGDCWSKLYTITTSNIWANREGIFLVTVGNTSQIVELSKCDRFNVIIDGSTGTFQSSNTTITDTLDSGQLIIKTIWLGESANKGQIYEQDDLPAINVSVNETAIAEGKVAPYLPPDSYKFGKFISPFEDMGDTPANTGMFCVGSVTLPKGDYIIQRMADDICDIYLNGQHLPSIYVTDTSYGEIAYTSKTNSKVAMLVYDKNVPNNTPSWFQMTFLNASDRSVYHPVTKNDFEFSIITPLKCIEG